MLRDVLAHILDVTDARPRGADRWMGHGLCHGSKRNRDLSIRLTSDRILLHDFTGCELSSICHALGIRLRDLFFDAPVPRASRATPKPPRVDRRQIAYRLELQGLLLGARADAVFWAAGGLDTSRWSDTDFDVAMDAVGRAYDDLRHAVVLFDVADSQRERAYAEENKP